MDERKNKQEEVAQAAALERAERPKRPSDITNDGTEAHELPADDMGFKRPVRVEHTSEKEHPPGKQ